MPRGTAQPTFQEREDRNQELLAAWRQCATQEAADEAFDQIILYNLDLCESLARRYANKGIDSDDLVQVARAALVGAVHRYRPGSPNFVAFAILSIKGELKRHFRDFGWTVRPPRRLQELRAQVVVLRDQVEQELQGDVSAEELSDRLGSTPAEVRECEHMGSSFRPLSLEAPLDRQTGSGTLAEQLGDADGELELLPDVLSLRTAVAELSDRDRRILHLRFVEDLTQAEIGKRLGVSQMQVSRLLNRILAQLREMMGTPEAAA